MILVASPVCLEVYLRNHRRERYGLLSIHFNVRSNLFCYSSLFIHILRFLYSMLTDIRTLYSHLLYTKRRWASCAMYFVYLGISLLSNGTTTLAIRLPKKNFLIFRVGCRGLCSCSSSIHAMDYGPRRYRIWTFALDTLPGHHFTYVGLFPIFIIRIFWALKGYSTLWTAGVPIVLTFIVFAQGLVATKAGGALWRYVRHATRNSECRVSVPRPALQLPLGAQLPS